MTETTKQETFIQVFTHVVEKLLERTELVYENIEERLAEVIAPEEFEKMSQDREAYISETCKENDSPFLIIPDDRVVSESLIFLSMKEAFKCRLAQIQKGKVRN